MWVPEHEGIEENELANLQFSDSKHFVIYLRDTQWRRLKNGKRNKKGCTGDMFQVKDKNFFDKERHKASRTCKVLSKANHRLSYGSLPLKIPSQENGQG